MPRRKLLLVSTCLAALVISCVPAAGQSTSPGRDWHLSDTSQTATTTNATPALFQEPAYQQPQDYGDPLGREQSEAPSSPWDPAVRFGWWGVDPQGDRTKIGEFQDLKSSPFWDVDGLWSNGRRTLDFHATGLDLEGNDAGLYYYGRRFSADVDYERFLRRRDHDPLSNFTDFQQQTPIVGDPLIREDTHAGQDYAIRVQELKANFKGRLTGNIRWRLDLWGMRKQGERQANAVGHCFFHPNAKDTNGNPVFGVSCHVLSQRQRIDWRTMQVTPAVEVTLGPVTAEYSRTMRSFDQDDQALARDYNFFGFGTGLPYAIVPENFTQIDRLRLSGNLFSNVRFYANLFTGDTHNKFRDTDRNFYGYDVRVTEDFSDKITLVGYAKRINEDNQLPSVLRVAENEVTPRHPIDYQRTTAGLKGRWRPFRGEYSLRSRLSLTGGYEYRSIERGFGAYTTPAGTFDDSLTKSNSFFTNASMRWSPQVDSFVRYRYRATDQPLFGVPRNDTTISTLLPETENLIEVGATWTPTTTFLVSTTFGIEDRRSSNVGDFEQDDYPIAISAWYVPTRKLSITGGLAFYSNWIDQDITLGAGTTPAPFTSRWDYSGRSDVANVGARYAWSESLTFLGNVEYVRSHDRFGDPPAPVGVDYGDLPALSDVLVEITRCTAGFDYRLRGGVSCYFRYNYFDYEDKSVAWNSGTAHMFLGGLTAVY